jgi:hypothetical protein
MANTKSYLATEKNLKRLSSLMALLAARSKTSLVFVAVVLMMALATVASVSAGLDDDHCVQLANCDTNACGACCAIAGISGNGTCKVVSRSPTVVAYRFELVGGIDGSTVQGWAITTALLKYTVF